MTSETAANENPIVINRSFILTVIATSLGFLLVQLDVTIVNVALVAMGAELHAAMSGLQWVVDAYAIAFASLLLSAGAIGDRVGPRRVLAAGFAVFVVASAGCGFALTPPLLVVARAVQGLGAALMVPSSLALLNFACHDNQKLRANAIAWWTAAGSIGLAAGPIIGGFLIHWLGWRSIFFVNVPLGILAICLTLFFVVETNIKNERKGFDLLGQLFCIAALTAFTGSFIEAGERGILDPLVLGCLAVAIASGAMFILIEARATSRGTHPMLALTLFRNPQFSSTIAVGFVINFTLYGFLFVLGFYFQHAHGYSPEQTGMAFLPLSIAVGVANIFAGWLMTKTGARAPMMWGLICGALGFAFLTRIDSHTAYILFVPSFLLISCGVGSAVPAMTTALLSTVGKDMAGVASGALNMTRQAAGAVGVALLGMVGGHSERSMAGLHATFWIGAALLLVGAIVAAFGIKRQSAN